jgi:hypothetical protein
LEELVSLLAFVSDVFWGWLVWTLAHNLGHRWWHIEMTLGKKTPYAHGEREHHRVYDRHGDHDWHTGEDPRELFISFPFFAIAPIGLLFVATYGWLRGWEHAPGFALAMYASMILDHRPDPPHHPPPQLLLLQRTDLGPALPDRTGANLGTRGADRGRVTRPLISA